MIKQNNFHDYVVMSQRYYVTTKNDLHIFTKCTFVTFAILHKLAVWVTQFYANWLSEICNFTNLLCDLGNFMLTRCVSYTVLTTTISLLDLRSTIKIPKSQAWLTPLSFWLCSICSRSHIHLTYLQYCVCCMRCPLLRRFETE